MSRFPLLLSPGDRFHRWTIIGVAPQGKNWMRHWHCRCDCGEERIVLQTSLRSGKSFSCGCYHREKITRHGRTWNGGKDPEYMAWQDAKRRCFNPKHRQFQHWGGRGITMAPEFVFSFENFLAEAGPRPGPDYSIDRIDNERGYEPGNLRWATRLQQARNTRWVKHNIETAREIRALAGRYTRKELAKKFRMAQSSVDRIVWGTLWTEDILAS